MAREATVRREFDYEFGFPATPFGWRWLRLVRACGWGPKEWPEKFGYDSNHLYSMLGSPSPRIPNNRTRITSEFVLRLQALEKLYAEDLENYDWLLSEYRKRHLKHKYLQHNKRRKDGTYGWRAGDKVWPKKPPLNGTVGTMASLEIEYEARRTRAKLRRLQGSVSVAKGERFNEAGDLALGDR